MTAILPRIRTALTMGLDRQMLVVEAAARLLAARLILGIVPFPQLAAGWGNLIAPSDQRGPARVGTIERGAIERGAGERSIGERGTGERGTGERGTVARRRIARRVRWAIATMAPLMPFRAACVQQAVAARGMLARRGIVGVVHFGIGRGALAAGHAWVDAEGVNVTGFPLDPALVELGRFVRCP